MLAPSFHSLRIFSLTAWMDMAQVSDPRDLARLREAVDMLFQIAQQDAIQAVLDPDQPAPVLALTSGVG